MNKISKFVAEHPLGVIVSIVLITIVFALACTRISLETDIKKLLPRSYPSVMAFDEIDEKFGGSDFILIAVTDDEIFDYATLSKIDQITSALKEVSGVGKVFSITQMDEIKSVEGGIEVAPIIASVTEDPKEIKKLKKKLLTDDKYVDVFVSKDSKAALIMAKLLPVREQAQLIDEVEALLAEMEGPEKIYLSGTPAIIEIVQDWIKKDLLWLLPLVVLLIILVLFFSFRTWYGIVFPLLSVVISVIWSVGMMAILNQPLTIITSIMPILLVSVGSAYGIHILARYQEESNGASADKKKFLQKIIATTGVGVFVAAVTTAVGFASNSFSSIWAIRVFGLSSAFGVMVAFMVSVTFIPALLQFVKPPKAKREEKISQKDDLLGRFLNSICHFVTERRFVSSGLAIFIFILAAIAYPQITTESDMIKYFSEKSDVVKAYNLIKDRFGGSITIEILINGDLKDPVLLNKMEKLQNEMEKIEYINNPTSIVDALKETNRLMNDDKEEFEKLPESRDGVAQYLLLLSMTGGDFLENIITSDYEDAKIQARISTSTTSKIDELVNKVEGHANDIFGNTATVKISGMAAVMRDLRRMLIQSQVRSLLIALVAVFLMVFLVYRSLLGSIFCMIPIIFTLLYNFGVMGWLGIPLDIATVMIGSIAVGIGIDYTVHFFNRYKEERKRGQGRKEGIRITIKTVGRAIIYNATAVALGFLVLLFSQFEIFKNFGLLVSLTMVFSSFGALSILPDLIMLKFRIINFNHVRKTRR